MKPDSTVLVTGATGFLGRHLVKRLEEDGHTVYALPGSDEVDLCDPEELNKWVGENLPVWLDYIFHLATKINAGSWPKENQAICWVDNTQIHTTVLDFWRRYQPQAKMITMGTSCSYPKIEPNKYGQRHLREEQYLEGDPDPELYGYVSSKRHLLYGLRAMADQYGLKYAYFIPATLYGPNFDDTDNHFIFDFIRNCRKAKDEGTPFTIWGDGTQRRELVYVDDVVNIMLELCDEVTNDILNIGHNSDYSILEYAQKVKEIVGYEGDILHKIGDDVFVGVKQKKLATNKLSSLLLKRGGFTYTTLEEGLQKSIYG